MQDVLVLIDELDDTLNGAKSGIRSSHVKVDKEETYAILDRMRATIPEEIKQARWISKERQEMLEEAKREVERILEAAREERERLVDPEEITKLAERRAEKILEEARTQERHIRLAAEDYADGILGSLEGNLERFSGAIQRGRERLIRDEE
jgi:cell division septum initiation protein DivIVA